MDKKRKENKKLEQQNKESRKCEISEEQAACISAGTGPLNLDDRKKEVSGTEKSYL